ncbi:hypothetical protein L195_g058903, partial [Trifolium pratense]
TRPPRFYQNKNHYPADSSRPAFASAAANDSLEPSQTAFSVTNLGSLLRQLILSGNTPAALSTTPGNSKWYFDSACCNHMTSASHLFSSISKNDITRSIHTADGSLMHDPRTGQLIGTGSKIGRLYELTELHVPHESNICA